MMLRRTPLAAAAALAALLLLPFLDHAAAQKTATVGIVGAGFAGIRAASILQAAGVDYIVLEASDRVGGRVRQTEILPYGGANLGPNKEYVELGANWVQGLTGNPIYDLVKTCGLNGTPQNWDSVITFDEAGKPLPDNKIPWRQFDTAMKCAASTVKQAIESNAYGDLDVRAAYRVCGWNPVKPIDYAVEWYSVNFEWSETAEMISSRFTQPDNVYSDFEDADIFANQQTELGLAKLVTCLASRSNVTSNKIKLNTKVTSFAVTNQDKVTVKTTGDTYTFDYVINTMPIGHLQRNLDTLFPTSLITPAKRAALMQFRMGTYTKIFLKFESTFWDPTTQFILQAPNNGASNTLLWQSLNPSSGDFLPGSNILFMTASLTDVMAASIENLSDEQILQNMIQRLQQIYPQANTTSPYRLIGYVIPRWYTNDLFGGSFTNWPAGMGLDAYELWRAPVGTPDSLARPGKILFSGEAACRRMNGYMSGGYGAGERSANQILKALGKFAGDPDENICERKLTSNGKPLGNKARGSGRAV